MTSPDTPEIIAAREFCRAVQEAFRDLGRVVIRVVERGASQ